MAEFISLIISFLIMAIADSVDAAFSNSISVDVVIAVGCIDSILRVAKAVSKCGSYVFRVQRTAESKCVEFDLITGFLVGVIFCFSRGSIVKLFDISPAQSKLVCDILAISPVYMPMYAVSNTSFEVTRIVGKLKEYRIAIIWFYAMLLLSDFFILILTYNIVLIYAGTCVCWFIITLYFIKVLKLRPCKLDKGFLSDLYHFGLPIAFERFVNGIVHSIYGVLASYMGEARYAIHTVCYGAILTAQSVTNAYNATLILKLHVDEDFHKALNKVKYWVKQISLVLFGIYSVYCLCSIVLYSGKVGVAKCFPWFFLYMSEFFGLLLYESMKCLVLSQKCVKCYTLGCLGGFVVRTSFAVIGLLSGLPLVWFSIGSTLDWATRGVIYYKYTKYKRCRS